MTYVATGHRPDKLGGYSLKSANRLEKFALETLSIIAPRPKEIYIGMAQGWDQAIASACYVLNIPYIAAIPFSGQELVWDKRDQEYYHWLVSNAAKRIVVCQHGFVAAKMNMRNRWMVDMAEIEKECRVLALWNGEPGGTANCVEYANEKKVEVCNVWPVWERWPG